MLPDGGAFLMLFHTTTICKRGKDTLVPLSCGFLLGKLVDLVFIFIYNYINLFLLNRQQDILSLVLLYLQKNK